MPKFTKKRGKPRRKNIQTEIKKYMRKTAEVKRFSHSHNTTLSTSGSTLALCDAIVAGTGSNQRVGHEIRLTGFYTKLSFQVADTVNLIRVVVYKARQTGLTLQSDGVTPISIIDPDKYYIYYDRLIQLSSDKQLGQVIIKRKLGNQLVRYDSTSGAPLQNSVQMYMVSDSSIAPHPSVQGVSYLYYQDF